MSNEDVQSLLKAALSDHLKGGKECNSALWQVSKQIGGSWRKEVKDAGKQVEQAQKSLSDELEELVANPLSKERRIELLEGIYDKMLLSGDVDTQFLDKYHKIIGVDTDEDDRIEIVDFSDAFPDYETAIRICQEAQPEICKCGGVIEE